MRPPTSCRSEAAGLSKSRCPQTMTMHLRIRGVYRIVSPSAGHVGLIALTPDTDQAGLLASRRGVARDGARRDTWQTGGWAGAGG